MRNRSSLGQSRLWENIEFAGNNAPSRPVTYTTILSVAARFSPILVLLLALLIAAPSAAQQNESPNKQSINGYEGRIIDSIQFEPADQPLTEEELKQKLPIRPGSVLTGQAVKEAIQNLFATGRYSDLAVDAAASGSDVMLRFLTKPAYFVGRIAVLGVKQPPNNGQLASVTRLRLGTPYRESDRDRAIQSLQYLLRQNGFFRAGIKSTVTLHSKTESADLAFTVDTGPRARFTGPVISGNPELSTESIIRATHWKRLYGLLGWQDVTEARVRQGLENLRRSYEKEDHLQAKVTLTKLDYEEASNRARPVLDLQAGPRIVISVEGANIGRRELSQLVPVFQEESVDTELLIEGQQNITQYLQSRGFFDATVTYKRHSGAAYHGELISYQVTRGRRYRFVHLSIVGNRFFSRRTIRERLYLEPAVFPRFPYGRFSRAYLKQDIQSVTSLYISNGFRDVRVSSRLVNNYRGKRDLAVFISIEEGSQWRVSNLSLEGVSPAAREVLYSRLASTEGQPFSTVSIAGDRDAILNYYYGLGYVNAAFAFDESPGAGPHSVDLRYVITPGIQEYVRDVLLSGLETTRKELVTDRISLSRGDPLSLTAETDSQRRLYDLAIFARVNTAVQNPEGDETERYVLYDVDEARHYLLNVGVGAQIARIAGGATSLDNPAGTTGFAPRLAVGISRINLLGLGQTLGLQTAASTIEQRAALTYFIPQFGALSNLNLTATGLIENSNDIRTFTAHRREASLQLGQKLSRAYSLQYRAVFRDVTLSNLKINQLLVPLLSQPERLGLGEFSVIEDKRDDPADAHRGTYSTADLSYAPRFLGSQTGFARALFRNSTYHELTRGWVFARNTQFGIISRTGGGNTIPLAERLYSGGSTSLRSFPDFQAGPRDLKTGFVLGGNASLVNNLELRFPLYGDNVRGVLFEDAGNVYSSVGDISFRFRQRNLQDFNYMVQSAGIGIRYQTPIGPVRLDFSFSPDAPRFFGLKGTLQDLINNTAVSTVQKINSFQFHFSLGQAF